MKIAAFVCASGLFLGTVLSPVQSLAAVTWSNKYIGMIIVDTRPCAFFQLGGVGQADPVSPSNPWLSIGTTDPNYQVLVSMMMTAKAGNLPVTVVTDGTLACGNAHIQGLYLD
jgi:hypothetical protein